MYERELGSRGRKKLKRGLGGVVCVRAMTPQILS